MLPEAGHMAWWVHAWLRGLVPTDTVLEHLHAMAPVQSVRSVGEGGPQAEGAGLLPLLGLLRREDVRHVGASFVVPGDPAGLAGPREFNTDALEANQAFLAPLAEVGAVPRRVGAGLTWTLHRAHRRPPGDVGEADRHLRTTLNRALDALVDLDIASWSPDTADDLSELARAPELEPPPGVPPVAARLASRSLHLWAITERALGDAGGATSSALTNLRGDVLEQLGGAARHALAASCSSDAWPEP